LFGQEGAGLPGELVEAADGVLTIPMNPAVNSLNVAVSAGLVVYEAYRQKSSIGAVRVALKGSRKTALNASTALNNHGVPTRFSLTFPRTEIKGLPIKDWLSVKSQAFTLLPFRILPLDGRG
jgi:hypothetical protein